jgi:hypothetical protein
MSKMQCRGENGSNNILKFFAKNRHECISCNKKFVSVLNDSCLQGCDAVLLHD